MIYRVKFAMIHNKGEQHEYGETRLWTFVPEEEIQAVIKVMFERGYQLQYVVNQYKEFEG